MDDEYWMLIKRLRKENEELREKIGELFKERDELYDKLFRCIHIHEESK